MEKIKIIGKKSLATLEIKRNKLSLKVTKVEDKINDVDKKIQSLENKKTELNKSIEGISAYNIAGINYDLNQKSKGVVYVQYYRLVDSYTTYKRYLDINNKVIEIKN